jgi:hypothetical protein
MKDTQVILYDSPEAARVDTATGWRARNGQFFEGVTPLAEDLARYAGSTHKVCQACGTVMEKMWLSCSACRAIKRRARWESFPEGKWEDHAFICDYDGDEYWHDIEEFEDWCDDMGVDPTTVMLVGTEPVFVQEIDPRDLYQDDIPSDDGELPDEIIAAFDKLNETLRACKTPLCWKPVNIRIVYLTPVDC